MTDKRETADGAAIGPDLIEKWALSYLERFATSAENLRRVLLRRVRRRLGPEADPETAEELRQAIAMLIARYQQAGLLDDAVYAASRARSRLARGQSLRKIRNGLAAKGIAADDAAAAIAGLQEGETDPDLAAACAFARRRRLGPFRISLSPDETDRDLLRQRDLAAFARAGFERRAAEAVLACCDPEEVTALLAP